MITIKMDTNKWVDVIALRNNVIPEGVREIFKTKFNSDPSKLKELEDEIQTLKNTQEYINQFSRK